MRELERRDTLAGMAELVHGGIVNPVLMLCYGNLELTKKAYASILAQDIEDLTVFLIDNGSTDGTWEWMNAITDPRVTVGRYPENTSPVVVANDYADLILKVCRSRHVLAIPNDCVLPTNCYRELLKFPHGFVAASMNGPEDPPAMEAKFVHNGFHMAVMLTRKWAYDAMVETWGFFLDPAYFHYGSDCDFKQRTNRMGILGAQTDLACWHYGSASWRLADPEIARQINRQADIDRETYFQKWGERL